MGRGCLRSPVRLRRWNSVASAPQGMVLWGANFVEEEMAGYLCQHCCSDNPEMHDITCPNAKGEARDPLLVERGKTHGDFSVHAAITVGMEELFYKLTANTHYKIAHKEALHMIFHKLGRIGAGKADFKDHWDDIAGYAKLGAEACDA